jgi:hypothetical protein
MIPYEVDPTLHTAPPAPPQLDDGFAPALPHEELGAAASHRETHSVAGLQPDRAGLNSEKSLF